MILTRRTFVRAVPVISLAASTSAFAGGPDFLSAPTVSMDALRSYVMDVVRSNQEVEYVYPLGADGIGIKLKAGREFQFGFSGTLAELNANPSLRIATIETDLKKVNEIISASAPSRESVSTNGKLMPVLRHQRAVDVLYERVRAQARGTHKPEFIQRPFLPDVVALVVLDTPNIQKYVTVNDPILKGMEAQSAFDAAIRNNSKYFYQTVLQDIGGFYLVNVDLNYNSSLLLFAQFWKYKESELCGPILVVAPDRETVVFGRESSDNRDALRNVLTLPSQNQPPVCDRLMRYSQGRWSYVT